MDHFLKPGIKLIEFGCGNGRDATFFGANGVDVLAIDQVNSVIEELAIKNSHPDVKYVCADFTSLDPIDSVYDAVYSRFTLHSVPLVKQHHAIKWSARALKKDGLLLIEARGLKNSLYQKGAAVAGEKFAYIYQDHYRRFISKEALDAEVLKTGLTIISSEEARGFAPFGDDDDTFIRLIAKK